MAGWEEQQRVDDPNSWDKARDRLSLARRLNPLNADYSADLGRLMEWRSWQELSDGTNGMMNFMFIIMLIEHLLQKLINKYRYV